LDQPQGRGAIGKVTSVGTSNGRQYAMVDFGRGYSVGIYFSELSAVNVGNGVVTSTQSGTCYNFSSNLSIGSTGADVVALQTFLINNGFDIPGVSSRTIPMGTFDSGTKLLL